MRHIYDRIDVLFERFINFAVHRVHLTTFLLLWIATLVVSAIHPKGTVITIVWNAYSQGLGLMIAAIVLLRQIDIKDRMTDVHTKVAEIHPKVIETHDWVTNGGSSSNGH